MARKLFALLALQLPIVLFSQIACVQCFHQNDSISDNVHNLILNGGFEQNNCAQFNAYYCPNSSYYACDITNWTCTGGGSATYASLYDNTMMAVVQGTTSCYMGNSFCSTCTTTGDTSCLVSNGCTVDSLPAGQPANDPSYGGTTGVILSQTVNGLTPGDCYVLEFWSGGEDGGNVFSNPGLFAVDVGFGNIYLRCEPTDPNTAFVGTRYIVQFRATSASHTIKFTNWGHICSSCTELVLDDVKLYTNAELNVGVTNCSPQCTVVPPPPPPPAPEPVCDVDSLIIPNVFTPNNTAPNDTFLVVAPCEMKAEVYDRWGMRVFTQQAARVGWDGTYNGKPVAEGVYYYIIELNGKTRKGFVHVIR